MQKARDHYFDNLKVLLIFLVVLGHFIQPIHMHGADFLEYYLYIFHMPLFVFVSGFFSKNSTFASSVQKLLIPFIILQIIYYFLQVYYVGNQNYTLRFFVPAWSMWYLFSLFVWRLVMPYLKNINPTYLFVLSIIIAVVSSYDPTIKYFFSMNRVLVFFPFFIAGYYFNRTAFTEKFVSAKFKVLSASVLGVIAIYTYLNIPIINGIYKNGGWLHFNGFIDHGILTGFYRFLVLLIGFVICACVLILTPQKKFKISYMGRNTINVYILHGFVYWTARKYDIFNKYFDSKIDLLLMFLFAAALTFVLGTNIISKVLKPLFNVPLGFLYAKKETSESKPTTLNA